MDRAVEREKQAGEERVKELLQLIEDGKLFELAGEIKNDLTLAGTCPRDLEMIDYFQELVGQQPCNTDLRNWATEAVCWIYQIKKKRG